MYCWRKEMLMLLAVVITQVVWNIGKVDCLINVSIFLKNEYRIIYTVKYYITEKQTLEFFLIAINILLFCPRKERSILQCKPRRI